MTGGESLTAVGCQFHPLGTVSPSIEAVVEPGVWVVGVDVQPGEYHSHGGEGCDSVVQQGDIFGQVAGRYQDTVTLAPNQTLSTPCRWTPRQPGP